MKVREKKRTEVNDRAVRETEKERKRRKGERQTRKKRCIDRPIHLYRVVYKRKGMRKDAINRRYRRLPSFGGRHI